MREPRESVAEILSSDRRGRRTLVGGVTTRHDRFVSGAGAVRPEAMDSTLFEIGSITKVFTGTLLAEMHLRGEIDLRDPLSRHLRLSAPPRWRSAEPTLEDLATHRTGLPNSPPQLQRKELLYQLGLRRTDPWAAFDEESYLDAVATTKARRRSIGRMRYSSLAFGLLGDSLAQRAGRPYDELLNERVLAPLGMEETSIVVPDEDRVRLLQGHSGRGAERPPIEDLMPAAGSLRSSVRDLLLWLDACIDPPPGLLGRAIALAMEPRTRVSSRFSIGLGWLVLRRRAKPVVVWHNGGTWGFRSFAAATPEAGAGAVVLSNTSRSVDRLGFRIIDAVALQ